VWQPPPQHPPPVADGRTGIDADDIFRVSPPMAPTEANAAMSFTVFV